MTLKKASVLLKMSSKSLVIFEKASVFHFSEYAFNKSRNFYKSLALIAKSLHFSENAFKKNRNLYTSLSFSEIIFNLPRILKNKKVSHSQKKAHF
jgi:hypothetical protein